MVMFIHREEMYYSREEAQERNGCGPGRRHRRQAAERPDRRHQAGVVRQVHAVREPLAEALRRIRGPGRGLLSALRLPSKPTGGGRWELKRQATPFPPVAAGWCGSRPRIAAPLPSWETTTSWCPGGEGELEEMARFGWTEFARSALTLTLSRRGEGILIWTGICLRRVEFALSGAAISGIYTHLSRLISSLSFARNGPP